MAITVIELKNGDEIGRCTELLPNKMQCYRGADYTYTNDITESNKAPRQVCRYHAKWLIELEKERIRTENTKSVETEPTKTTEEDKKNVVTNTAVAASSSSTTSK